MRARVFSTKMSKTPLRVAKFTSSKICCICGTGDGPLYRVTDSMRRDLIVKHNFVVKNRSRLCGSETARDSTGKVALKHRLDNLVWDGVQRQSICGKRRRSNNSLRGSYKKRPRFAFPADSDFMDHFSASDITDLIDVLRPGIIDLKRAHVNLERARTSQNAPELHIRERTFLYCHRCSCKVRKQMEASLLAVFGRRTEKLV